MENSMVQQCFYRLDNSFANHGHWGATKAWFALSSMLIYRAAFSLSLGPLTSQRRNIWASRRFCLWVCAHASFSDQWYPKKIDRTSFLYKYVVRDGTFQICWCLFRNLIFYQIAQLSTIMSKLIFLPTCEVRYTCRQDSEGRDEHEPSPYSFLCSLYIQCDIDIY